MVCVGGVKKESGLLINGKIVNNKILLNTVQWYITHTCNLACKHCLSFNNFSISGHESFADNMIHAQEWNKLVTIKDFTIIGGETFTHNDLNTWVHGLRDIFSYIEDFKVITNGSMLEKYENCFDSWFEKDVIIEISTKTKKDKENFEKFLTRYKNVTFSDHHEQDYAVYVDNKLRFVVEHCRWHREWAIKEKSNNVYKFWDNDANQAHKTCRFAFCHYFYKGDLYKCGTIVGAREFVKKFPVDASDRTLFESYEPIKYNDPDLHEKIKSLNFSVPLCSKCPAEDLPDKLILDSKKLLP